MSETEPTPTLTNLHEVAELGHIKVRDDILLRPLEVSDAEDILAILSADPAIRDRVAVASRLYSDADVADEVRAIEEDKGLLRHAIVVDGKVVGLVSFWRDDGFFGQPPDPKAYGSGSFLDPSVRNRGIRTAIGNKIMEIAQEVLDVDRFVAFCEDDNLPSQAALKKLGLHATPEVFIDSDHGWQERRWVRELR